MNSLKEELKQLKQELKEEEENLCEQCKNAVLTSIKDNGIQIGSWYIADEFADILVFRYPKTTSDSRYAMFPGHYTNLWSSTNINS